MIRFESPSRRTPLLVSQQIDHVLLTAKRLDISHEMQTKSLAAKNSAKNDYQWANAELGVVEEWAEKLFAAWIEIWDTQGLPRCHALYRAIFESELRTLFATRNGCFKGALQGRALVDRRRANDAAIAGWFRREMDRLSAKWNRKMDVESRKSMYAARREMSEAQASRATATPPLVLPAAIAAKPNGRSRPKPLTKPELKRRNVIFGAIQSGLKGPRYCSELDRRQLALPFAWIEQGCPATYTQAYRDARWRKRIQDEKCTYRERFDVTPRREREAIIEGNTGTRRTRH